LDSSPIQKQSPNPVRRDISTPRYACRSTGRDGRPTQAPGRPFGRPCPTESFFMSVGRPSGRPFSCYGRPRYPVHVSAHRSTGPAADL